MNLDTFDQTLGSLAASLGDPTRRGIYVAVRESNEPLTAGTLAERFDIHPNVARHHLDRLVDDGYLEVTERVAGGGAGRPAKGFRATDKAIELSLTPKREDLVIDLLLDLADRLGGDDVSDMARQVGQSYGRNLASELEGDLAEAVVLAVAGAMGTMGFVNDADAESGVILTSQCPFGDTANQHPEIVCSLDQGIVDGLLEVLDPQYHSLVIPHAKGATCETKVGTRAPVAFAERA